MKHHILMGDIVSSSSHDERQLQKKFKRLVSRCNSSLATGILSPYTITLGDEFQGIAASLYELVAAIFFMEEEILRDNLGFQMRYVAHYGDVETPINPKIAHGMMGVGLTHARVLLTKKGRHRPRFQVVYGDDVLVSQVLSNLLYVLGNIVDRWKAKDYPLIIDMLSSSDNEMVGLKHSKNRSQIYKRRISLRVEEYQRLKESVLVVAERFDFAHGSS